MVQNQRMPGTSQKTDQPPVYYSVRRFQTLSGMYFEVCDDPKGTYCKMRTSAGSVMEMRHNGDTVELTVGDKNTDASGKTASVSENEDCWGGGHKRTGTTMGTHDETGGQKGCGQGAVVSVVVMGPANIFAESGYYGVNGDLNVNIKGNMDWQVGGSITRTVGVQDSTKAPKITHN